MSTKELIEILNTYEGDTEVLISTNPMTFKHILEVNDEDYVVRDIIYLEG